MPMATSKEDGENGELAPNVNSGDDKDTGPLETLPGSPEPELRRTRQRRRFRRRGRGRGGAHP